MLRDLQNTELTTTKGIDNSFVSQVIYTVQRASDISHSPRLASGYILR